MASQHTMHIQKALSQMNLQIHHVLSEVTGVSGLAILDAILSGKRDPMKLASLCNWRVRSPREVVAKALVGDYRPEHLFTLRQSLRGSRYYQLMIAEVDQSLRNYCVACRDAKAHQNRCRHVRKHAFISGRAMNRPSTFVTNCFESLESI